MSDSAMDRKKFLANVGKLCMGTCACAAVGGFSQVFAQTTGEETPKPQEKPRSEVRMEFAEGWLKRFFNVLDSNLDEKTRTKIMMANGKACYLNWIKETNQEIKPITLERLTAWVKANVKDSSYAVDGNVIYFQYTSAAETGQPSAEGACLCPLVESKVPGLSSTYCICSVGYVKVMHELLLQRPIEVQLIDSVLRGGKRCKFKITVA